MHLGLDHIGAGGAAVAALAPDVVQRDGERDAGVEQRFEEGCAVELHAFGLHVVADIAHQHQAAAGQSEFAALRVGIAAIFVEPAHHGAATLGEAGFQPPVHQPQPVAIHIHLVGGIDRGNRILAILDGGDGRLDHQVGHAGRIGAADAMAAIDADLHVQRVVAQQDHRGLRWRALPAHVARRIGKSHNFAGVEVHGKRAVLDRVARGIGMAALRERRDFVEERAAIGDHARAARGVVAPGGRIHRQDGIGAIQRVVQADPAGIGRIQRIARVADGHHELRAGDGGDLRIDVGRVDADALRLIDQIADAAQEGGVRGDVEGLPLVLAPPGIDAGL
jgi:hypothetical protein